MAQSVKRYVRVLSKATLHEYMEKSVPVVSPDTPLIEILRIMGKKSITHVLVGYSDNEILGVIPLRKILYLLAREPTAFPMLTADLFTKVKPVSIKASKTVLDAIKAMVESNVLFLMVTDDQGGNLGSLFETTIVKSISENIRLGIDIGRYMEKRYPYAFEDHSLREALLIMGESKDKYLSIPVVSRKHHHKHEILGVFSASRALELLSYATLKDYGRILNYSVTKASYADLVSVHPRLVSSAALDLAVKYGLRVLVVSDGSKVYGIITPRTFLKIVYDNIIMK